MNRKMHSSRLPLLGLLSAGSLALAAVAHAQSPTVSIAMAKPDVAGAVQTGFVPSSAKLSMAVALAPSNRAAFEEFANSVSDPASPNYRRFISPEEVGKRFGPSVSTLNATVKYLQSKGMTITYISPNRMAVLFTGRADKVSSAFATKLATFSAPSRTDGPKKFFSYLTAPKLPATFASSATTIDGLQNAYVPVHKSTITPAQARVLYNATNLYGAFPTGGRKGEGINIGITNYDGYRLSNLPLFYSTFNLPAPTGGVGSNVTAVSINNGNGNLDVAGGEGDLDIQMVLGAAPKSHVFIYDTGNTVDSYSTYTANYLGPLVREAGDDVVDIVSESYGFPTNETTRGIIVAAHDQHLAMTSLGITYLLASGDHGTYDPYLYPDFDPDVLNVGGTVATVDAAGNRIAEDGWIASGGGYGLFDVYFNVLPPYQKGLGVPTNVDKRLVPDIALHASGGNKTFEDATYGLADFAFYVIDGGSSSVASGTSASSPLFAGQLGTILQELSAQNAADIAKNGRPRLGRINDFLYTLNGDSSVFFDVTTGSLYNKLPDGGTASAGLGWDYVTGLGAPDIDGLYDAFLTNSSLAKTANAVTAAVFQGFGTNLAGATVGTTSGVVDNLVATEGNVLSLTTVRKAGLGQVAAAMVDIKLGYPNRRSAALNITMTLPNLTTGYVYLYDFTTGAFDQRLENVTVVTGTGAVRTVNRSISLDSNYIDPATQTVRVLVRAIKPARLGTAPFTITVDQATVTERVPRAVTP